MKVISLFINLFFSSLCFAGTLTPLKLALNWKPEPQFGGFYQAKVADLYKAEGLDVEVLPGGSGTPTVQMLANGKVDAAIVSAEEILISNEKNPKNPLVAVFATFQINPQMIMVRAERPISDLKQVFQSPGIVAMQSGLTYAQFLLKKFAPIKAKIVPYQGGISYIEKDINTAQQGFVTSEPLVAEKAGLKVKTFLAADEGFNPYTTVVAVRKSDLDKNGNRYVSLIKAVRAGWQAYLADPAKANAMMAGLNKGMDAETFQKSAMAQKQLISEAVVGSMTEARWQSLIDQMKDLKVIKKALVAKDQFQNL